MRAQQPLVLLAQLLVAACGVCHDGDTISFLQHTRVVRLEKGNATLLNGTALDSVRRSSLNWSDSVLQSNFTVMSALQTNWTLPLSDSLTDGAVRLHHGLTMYRSKEVWLLLEVSGAGLLGLDRMYLGGSNVPMGLLKALWNVPSLGVWSTIDRIYIIRNALKREDAVDVLDMQCAFTGRLERAYKYGLVGAGSSLVVLAIGLVAGVVAVREMVETAASASREWFLITCMIYVAGLNVAIALSAPLLALAVPGGLGLLIWRTCSGLLCCAFQRTPKPVKVNVVKAATREHLCWVEAEPQRQVNRLKIAIRSTLGVPTQMQRLTIQNQPLKDSDTLQDLLGLTRLDKFKSVLALDRRQYHLEVGITVEETQAAGVRMGQRIAF